MTLGSLFDGSGGFPLAGILNDIYPLWSSEIEPYPLKVTAANMPWVKQLGDVRNINGALIEPVDIITFGSPCQNLSIAGNREGLINGKESNLFFEAIRIIREMRQATDGKYPKYAVFENVMGAFSSNKGEDFRAVLQAFADTCEDGLDIPRPPKGKWSHAGAMAGDGWSVAWRVYNAQYWGVPQRRRRLYLIGCFGTERAAEILFECESLSGHFESWGEAREGHAPDDEGSTGRSCLAFLERAGKPGGGKGLLVGKDKTFTLGTSPSQRVCYPAEALYSIYDARGNGNGHISPTLTGDHQNRITDYTAICVGNGQLHQAYGDKTGALNCMHDQQIVVASSRKPPRRYIVRRLTPLECCRLQGFPDWWEDGVEGSDSARYRMWGNGIALPCAEDVLRRIAKEGKTNG